MVTATAPSLEERPEYNPGDLVDYAAQTGDTLPALAAHFNTTIAGIRAANPQIPVDATTLQPGMPMKIPITYSPFWGTPLQIMPDSLFVDGPSANGFDTGAFVSSHPGWLKDYREDIGDANRSAAEIINIVATNFSISPRALLVLLEYQTGALSQPGPPSGDYPLGHVDENAAGLYRQLVYAGNILNAGYYGWRTGGLTQLVFPDYTIERPDPWQTAATVAFQYYYSLSSQASYARATGPDGLRRRDPQPVWRSMGCKRGSAAYPGQSTAAGAGPAFLGGLCLGLHRRSSFRLGGGSTPALGGDRFCPAGARL